jgi:hypothetical protein
VWVPEVDLLGATGAVAVLKFNRDRDPWYLHELGIVVSIS